MKQLGLVIVLAMFAVTGVYAKDEPKAPTAEQKKELTPQQQKMGDCNKEASAKNLKGEDRKAFMQNCLGHKPPQDGKQSGKTAQRQKMADCNKEASTKQLKGDERKKFMSECLSADKK